MYRYLELFAKENFYEKILTIKGRLWYSNIEKDQCFRNDLLFAQLIRIYQN